MTDPSNRERVPPEDVRVERPVVERLREIDAAVREVARKQPLLAALGAVSLGYLFGRALRRL